MEKKDPKTSRLRTDVPHQPKDENENSSMLERDETDPAHECNGRLDDRSRTRPRRTRRKRSVEEVKEQRK